MSATTEQIILSMLKVIREEQQEFRTEVATWQRDICERVATLEQQAHDLCGNGQPGRVSALESAVSSLQRWRYWVLGAAAGVAGVVGVIVKVIN